MLRLQTAESEKTKFTYRTTSGSQREESSERSKSAKSRNAENQTNDRILWEKFQKEWTDVVSDSWQLKVNHMNSDLNVVRKP
jgi:hypothetical protein